MITRNMKWKIKNKKVHIFIFILMRFVFVWIFIFIWLQLVFSFAIARSLSARVNVVVNIDVFMNLLVWDWSIARLRRCVRKIRKSWSFWLEKFNDRIHCSRFIVCPCSLLHASRHALRRTLKQVYSTDQNQHQHQRNKTTNYEGQNSNHLGDVTTKRQSDRERCEHIQSGVGNLISNDLNKLARFNLRWLYETMRTLEILSPSTVHLVARDSPCSATRVSDIRSLALRRAENLPMKLKC
jgi:hypothetical protein